jgi:dihydrofolate reductase
MSAEGQRPRCITLIAAVAENGIIGAGGRLPWHAPADLARFRALTTGHAVIMGRRTFEGIGRPLPERRTIVLSRRPDFRPPGCTVVHSPEEALAAVAGEEEVFIAGGGEIYRLFLPLAHRIQLTLVHAEAAGDTAFPPIPADMVETWRQEAPGVPPLTFIRYDRRPL